MDHKSAHDVSVVAEVTRASGLKAGIGLKTHYNIECRDKHGNLKWVEDFDNLVVTAGLNDNLDKYFKGSTYTAAWYVGLTGPSPSPAAGDTMSSHAGWVEHTMYTESVRQTLTLGSVSGGSVNNSASKATFSINTNGVTIGGAFLTTNNDKTASPPTGTLYGVGAFSGGNKTADSGDTLSVTVTLTASAA